MRTEIAVVLDKSGSMDSVKNDAIGGFNSFLEAQKNIPGEARFTLTLFDSTWSFSRFRQPLENVTPLTVKDYRPGDTTALYDAIGMTITEIGKALDETPEAERPEKVIVAILTDGHENSSVEYNLAQIKNMIEHQESKYAWEFIYLAANQDAFAVGAGMGFRTNNTVTFEATSVGTRNAYGDMSSLVTSYRTENSNSTT